MASYSSLRTDVPGHTEAAHTFGLTAEVLMPRPLGIPRTHLIGGLGVATRKLTEGREIREEFIDNLGYTFFLVSRVAYDERAVDAVGRLGLAVDLLRGSRWALSAECLYQASYSVIEPDELELNMRIDESVTAGLALRFDIN